MDFEEAVNQYTHLRNQWQSGQLTPQQFEEAVNALRVQTDDGVWWQMRAADGAWMRWNGTAWELAQTPQTPPAVLQKKKRSRRTTRLTILAVSLIILVCGLVLVGGGGYYLISTGYLSNTQPMNIVGPGTGEIAVVNLDDGDLKASLTRLDTEEGSPEHVGSETLAPLEIGGFGRVEAGRYQLEINASVGGVCTLEIVKGDEYQFVAVPEGIAVTRSRESVQSADELDMATSPWCRK